MTSKTQKNYMSDWHPIFDSTGSFLNLKNSASWFLTNGSLCCEIQRADRIAKTTVTVESKRITVLVEYRMEDNPSYYPWQSLKWFRLDDYTINAEDSGIIEIQGDKYRWAVPMKVDKLAADIRKMIGRVYN